MTRHRYLTQNIIEDLKEKMVFLSGPRQVGKTTISTDIIGKIYYPGNYSYYSWDKKQDRAAILHSRWADTRLIILDEFHKYKKWKTLLKGEYDTLKSHKQFLITGSARLDTYRKGGDSLQGRYHSYRVHPFSLSELNEHYPRVQLFDKENRLLPLRFSGNSQHLDTLLKFGGFPEPLLTQSDTHLRRWHKQRIDRFFREDVRDMTRVMDLDNMRLLGDLLPDKVGSLLSLNTLREDLEVSHRAINSWMKALESFYYHFRIYPYQTKRVRALKKEPKLYMWDWSEVKDIGARFENLIVSHLLKLIHYLQDYEGYDVELHFLRDKDKREVDFLVTVDKKPWFCVEAKLKKDGVPKSLSYFKEKLQIPYAYLVTYEDTSDYTDKDGVKVLPASKFLTALP